MVAQNDRRTQEFILVKSAINKGTETYRIVLDETNMDLVERLNHLVRENVRILITKQTRNVKWYIALKIIFRKAAKPDVHTNPPIIFLTESVATTDGIPIDLQLNVALRRLWKQIDKFETNGSGWIIDRFVSIDVNMSSFNPLRAGSYIALPPYIKEKRAVLNIKNNDNGDW